MRWDVLWRSVVFSRFSMFVLQLCVFWDRKLRRRFASMTFSRDSYELQKKYKDYLIVFPPQGFGEIQIVCSLLPYIRAKFQKKIVMVSTNKAYAELVDLYSNGFDAHEIIPGLRQKFMPPPFDLNIYRSEFIVEDDANMFNATLRLIGLPEDTKPVIPEIDVSDKIRALFLDMGLREGRTVLMSPVAKTFKYPAPMEDWNNFAQILKSKGYDVVFNMPKGNEFSFSSVFLPPKETIEFSKLCGNFLALRSGLCDVICSFSDIKSLLIYPYEMRTHAVDRSKLNPALVCYSIADMFGAKNTKELVYHPDLADDIDAYFS